MTTNIKELVKNIRAELDKLKDIKDEKVKTIYDNLTSYVEKLEPKIPKEDTGDNVDDEEAEEVVKEKKDDKETEAEAEETPKEEETAEEVKEEPAKETPEEPSEEVEEKVDKVTEKELSMEVSSKLKDAAIELQKFEADNKAKDEVIIAYKSQVTELTAQLEAYHNAERLELEKMYDNKVNMLIELYSNLKITKTVDEIKSNFKEEQVDKLIVDLSAMQIPKVQAKARRLTQVSLELNENMPQKISKKLTSADSAKLLFGMD